MNRQEEEEKENSRKLQKGEMTFLVNRWSEILLFSLPIFIRKWKMCVK